MDQNVVDVSGVGYEQVFAQCVIDEVREEGRGIGESAGHDGISVVAETSSKHGLPFFPIWHANQVQCALEVELGDPFGFV